MMTASYYPAPGRSRADELRDLRFRLAHLLRCSEEMLACAESGDWEGVRDMERRRRKDLEECFAVAGRVDETPLICEAVATLMYLNEQMVKVVLRARDEAA